MADAIAAGGIDAFCVGEPWGSIAVENGVGTLQLPTSAIRATAPEKVLAVRHEWAEAEPQLTSRLMRAFWKACRWLGNSANHTTAAEILHSPTYLDVSTKLLDRSLSGHLVATPNGLEQAVPGFLEFFDGAATFPWKSQAAWIGSQLAARTGLDRARAISAAKAVFRSDLYRLHMQGVAAEIPGTSEKLEGAMDIPTGLCCTNRLRGFML